MRAFIILSLAAVVFADVGYNYRAGSGSHSSGGLGSPDGHASSNGLSALGTLNGLGGLAGLNGAGGLGGTSDSHGVSGGSSAPVSGGSSAPATYEKEFYTFTAPENEFENDNAGQQITSIKKNLRVIFIKSPENKGLENAALQLAKQAAEDKTAIYVLQKQADIGSLAKQLQTATSQQSNKPEVHFVKYRTPEDAANAQKAIQSQYDQLAGNSQAHNGGVAPVLNFASRPAATQGPAPKAPATAYLPSSVLRLFRA